VSVGADRGAGDGLGPAVAPPEADVVRVRGAGVGGLPVRVVYESWCATCWAVTAHDAGVCLPCRAAAAPPDGDGALPADGGRRAEVGAASGGGCGERAAHPP